MILLSRLHHWWTARNETPEAPAPVEAPRARPRRKPEFPAFQTYLENRYAELVVLSFGQIEDLSGVPLPVEARTQPLWWLGREREGARYATAWRAAGRSAKPNLPAGQVSFERVEDRVA